MAYALAQAAQHLASKGRNGDSMLVHMNPIEVAWLNEQTPGGLTINPDTGQPEAFAFLLPLLAGMAGPSIMGALGLSGTSALLGSAALSGLADYAVNKDAKSALGSSLLSFGLGGLGNAFKGANAAKTGLDAATKVIPNAVNAATSALPSGVTNAAKVAVASNPMLSLVANAGKAAGNAASSGLAGLGTQQAGGMLSKLGTVGRAIQNPQMAMAALKSAPMTVGVPLAAGAAMKMGSMMEPVGYDMPEKDDRYGEEYQRERFPGPRTINPYMQDYSRYGITGPEHMFITPNNDRMASPPILGPSGLGAYGMANGGAVLGAGDGVSDSIPAVGPGQRPIQLSDGEYVIPADVVSMLGKGSTNGGIRYLDAMIAKTRDNPPRKEKGKPPQRMAA